MKCSEQCHFHTPGDFQLMLRKFSLTVLLKSVVSISKQWQGETWRKDRDIFGSDSYGTSIFGLDLRFHLQFWINIVLLVNKSFQQIIQFLPTISSYCGLTLVTLFSTMLLLNFCFMDFFIIVYLCVFEWCAFFDFTGFDELACNCGATVLYPPIPCGTQPPECDKPCSRTHACSHPGQTNF